MIFITSVWPVIINTAVGVRNIPQDYRNVAKVLRLNQLEFFFKVMVPSAAPYIFTGLRMASACHGSPFVAAEMLTGGVGIGFFIWDAWNSSRLSDIIVALVYIASPASSSTSLSPDWAASSPAALRTSTMKTHLKLDHVDKSFTRAVSSAMCCRHQPRHKGGEFVSIIGHSGCGKSTVLNLLPGFCRCRRARSSSTISGQRAGPERAVVFQKPFAAALAHRL